jgi:hypothetical protein
MKKSLVLRTAAVICAVVALGAPASLAASYSPYPLSSAKILKIHKYLRSTARAHPYSMFGMIAATKDSLSAEISVCGLANSEPYFGRIDKKGEFALVQMGDATNAGDVVRLCADHGIELGGQ